MCKLIIPAAGLGSRFNGAFKPLVPVLHGRSMLQTILEPLLVPEIDEVFVVAPSGRSQAVWDDIRSLPKLKRLMAKGFVANVAPVRFTQEGPALSVLCCMGGIADDAPVLVANSDVLYPEGIDSWFKDLKTRNPDGAMLTFEALDGDRQWSYARAAPHDPELVVEVAEKEPISTHATSGAYYFRQWRTLRTSIFKMVAEGERYKGEFYMAPVFNQMIKAGLTVRRTDVSDNVVNLGTPEQLAAWKEKNLGQ